jgi:hypothetical protein
MNHININYKQFDLKPIVFIFDDLRYQFDEMYIIYKILKALNYSQHRMDYHSF